MNKKNGMVQRNDGEEVANQSCCSADWLTNCKWRNVVPKLTKMKNK
jgi:hypothetical protein